MRPRLGRKELEPEVEQAIGGEAAVAETPLIGEGGRPGEGRRGEHGEGQGDEGQFRVGAHGSLLMKGRRKATPEWGVRKQSSAEAMSLRAATLGIRMLLG